jgi:hypothetical protein
MSINNLDGIQNGTLADIDHDSSISHVTTQPSIISEINFNQPATFGENKTDSFHKESNEQFIKTNATNFSSNPIQFINKVEHDNLMQANKNVTTDIQHEVMPVEFKNINAEQEILKSKALSTIRTYNALSKNSNPEEDHEKYSNGEFIEFSDQFKNIARISQNGINITSAIEIDNTPNQMPDLYTINIKIPMIIENIFSNDDFMIHDSTGFKNTITLSDKIKNPSEIENYKSSLEPTKLFDKIL